MACGDEFDVLVHYKHDTHTTKFASNQEIKQLLLDLLIRKTSVACQNIKIFLPVKIEDFAL